MTIALHSKIYSDEDYFCKYPVFSPLIFCKILRLKRMN